MSTPTDPAAARYGDTPEVERPLGRSIMRGLMTAARPAATANSFAPS